MPRPVPWHNVAALKRQRTLHVASATTKDGESMTGYGIEDVCNVELAIDDVDALQQEDAAQATLMAEATQSPKTTPSSVPCPSLKPTMGLATTIVHSAFCCSTPKERCCSSNGRRTRFMFPNVWANVRCSHHCNPEELELENAMGVK